MKKRLLAFVLVLAMMLPAMTQFVSAVPSSTYRYKFRIYTRNESNAGTNASIYAGFQTYNDGLRRVHLDDPDYDDFEKGSTHDYNIDLYGYP